MGGFQQMDHLVDHHVFQAFQRMFGQLQIQPDPSGLYITGAPAGFHALNAYFLNVDPQPGLVAFYDNRDESFKFLSVPLIQELLPFFLGMPRSDAQVQFPFFEFHLCLLMAFLYPQAAGSSQVVVAFSIPNFFIALSALSLQLLLLFLDPAESGEDKAADEALRHQPGG